MTLESWRGILGELAEASAADKDQETRNEQWAHDKRVEQNPKGQSEPELRHLREVPPDQQ